MLLAVAVRDAGPTLQTRWAAGVTPSNVHREYPRPQMVRKNWVNLNGTWTLMIARPASRWRPQELPVQHARAVLVPFPLESQLSGVRDLFGHGYDSGDTYYYTREFDRPKGDRVLLHFGAVNWKCDVFVNGQWVGGHIGGYDPFTIDITPQLTAAGRQRVQVAVTNPVDAGYQPRGKQVRKPGGIFYTASTGIWQTVWLEPVPKDYVAGYDVRASAATGQVVVTVEPDSTAWGLRARVELLDGGRVVASVGGEFTHGENVPENPGMSLRPAEFSLVYPQHVDWSPSNPRLYDLRISLIDAKGAMVDRVTGYCAFRDVSLVKGVDGQPRIALNGKPLFLFGTLDQGFWPDGVYTAPTDAAMKYDLEVTKRLGFNMIRKHVKVEPERWYTWCDRLGLVVLQDMPSGDRFIGPRDPDIVRSNDSALDFRQELQAMVDSHRNHPCIITWVLFNEGWGQSDTAANTKWLKAYDPTRLVDSTTGWADRGVGDYRDIHSYPGPDIPKPDPDRAIFLGEFGGLGLPEPGHMWLEKGWGYQSFRTSKALTDRFVELLTKLRSFEAQGLSGAVYTQTTDCETELNGLMTYDRAVVKMDEQRAHAAIAALFDNP